MTGPKKISTPRGEVMQVESPGGKVTSRIVWNASAISEMNRLMDSAQARLDSEVLRGSSRYVPFRTGMLDRSGALGTVIGSGEVRWIAPYAKARYYSNSMGSNGEAQRGGYWFERWKNANGKAVIATIKSMAGRRRT